MANLPPSNLFFPYVASTYANERNTGQKLLNSQAQQQQDYLAMFNKMNPAPKTVGGATGISKGTTLRQASQPPSFSSGSLSLPSSSTTSTTPGVTPTPATYELPTYDTSKVEGLAQRFAAPGIRNLRTAVQQSQQGYYDNPNVKAMTVRESLAGYGSGLESVMAGALKEGSSIYGQEYGAQVNKAGAEFGAANARELQANSIASAEKMQASAIASNEKLARYNNEWKAYLSSLT